MPIFPVLTKLCFIFIWRTCICIVQATVLTENLALNKESYLSDTDGDHAAHLANDGILANGMCAKTLSNDGHWEVDLGDTYLIGQIKVYNTDESCCSGHLKSVTFFTGETRESYIYHVMTVGPATSVYTWSLVDIVYARWIKISRKLGQKNPMTVCEVEVFERLLAPTTGISTTTTGSVTTGNPGTPTTFTDSAANSNTLSTHFFSMNNQKRAAGEAILTLMTKSERHCCFACLVTMTTYECESINYDKVTGECSLVKGLMTEDDADDNTVMLIPNTS